MKQTFISQNLKTELKIGEENSNEITLKLCPIFVKLVA